MIVHCTLYKEQTRENGQRKSYGNQRTALKQRNSSSEKMSTQRTKNVLQFTAKNTYIKRTG